MSQPHCDPDRRPLGPPPPTARRLEPEEMDDPALPAEAHHHALRGLARLNRVSGSARIVFAALADLARSVPTGETLRVLDLATGGGDVPVALWRMAAARGLRLTITGADRSEVAVARAREHARAAGAGTGVEFFLHDAVRQPIPGGYDVVVCSLFLHHLTDNEATDLLRRAGAAARRRLVVNDLERSPLSAALVWTAARLVTRSPVVHVDGPRSVRAAFTADELADCARRAGLANFLVTRRFPCRLLLRAETS